MNTPYRILHLEDDSTEATLVQAILEAELSPCAVTPVQNRESFVRALDTQVFDLVIADYSLPGFDGMTALKITRSKFPELPFILLSGTVGEEFAIESLKNGATDYIMKERRSRLVPAIHRAMREVADRAQRKLLEEQFVRAQKMEVVGQLASGIAHDFNNILGIIIGNNDFMMSKLRTEDPLRKNGEEIQLAAARAAAVTRQLLVFSRNQSVELVVLDINEVIQGMDKMLYRLVDEHIVLTVALDKNIGRIKADSGYLGQLLMNLVINARDAMPEGGSLVIATRNVTLTEKEAKEHSNLEPGSYVMLSVSDNGIGMTEEVKTRLFEAFFTTKPKGKGTGLGLATCLTIAKQSQAPIVVDSKLGKGTTFKIYFPRVDQPLNKTSVLPPSKLAPGGTETLLIVEDEPALCRMASLVLANLGYTVLQASSGKEGLRVASEHKGAPISLVVTDVVMPQMGGKAMADWLKITYPDIKILFTSGYNDAALADPNIVFLPKPYTLATLTAKIRHVLDKK